MNDHARRLVGPLVLFVLFLLPLANGFTDDGYIHIQYARNLIERGEYSFNPGEVSFGTTSPLWVMELAAIGVFFDDREALVAISRVLSWLAGIGVVVGVYGLALALGGSRAAATLAALTMAADAWLARWTALSMETSSAVLAVVLMAIASVRALESRRSAALLGFAMAIASLMRPEVYLAFPLYAVTVATLWRRVDRRCVAITVVVAAALLVPWLAFAKLHIGSFLPNTAGAKSGGLVLDPRVFVAKFAPVVQIVGSSQGMTVLMLLVGTALAGRRAIVFGASARFLTLWAVGLPVAYVLFDIQILSRYLSLIAPVVCVLGWLAVEQAIDLRARPERWRSPVFAVCLVAAVVANAVFYFSVVVPPSRAFSYDLQHEMRGVAEFLRENSQRDAVVAAADIGYLAFYSNRRVLDLGGLVEPETGALRSQHDYEEIVDGGLYFDVRGYPRVDYFIDRDLRADRFEGATLAGHRFEKVHAAVVRNLGIRKPGPYHYVLYRLTPVGP